MEVKTINGYTIKDETARNQLIEHESTLTNLKSELKFHSVADSSATYIVEFPNGKKMIIDTGKEEQWTDIKNGIDNLGITKFDYMIITHFHVDHIGNIQNICNTYDLSECICWVGMKPDFINHSEDIDEDEEAYDNVITLLEGYGLQPTVPVNDSYYTIDDNTKLHFLNTDTTIAEDYYNYIAEYRTEKINFNAFSLVTEIMHLDNNIIATGDIEYCAEKGIAPYVHKANLITTPHHGVNLEAYYGFYDSVNPEYSISTYITNSDNWVRGFYKSFMYLQEKGCRMITSKWTNSVDGLFTFISNVNEFSTNVKGEIKYVNTHSKASVLSSIHDVTMITRKANIELSINDVFENMNYGDELCAYWWESYNTSFATLYSEIQSLFPQFQNGWLIKFKKGDSSYKRIEISKNNNLTLSCEKYLENDSWLYVARNGNGLLSDITGQTNLLSALDNLPKGNYYIKSYTDDIGTTLVTTGAYSLTITILDKWEQSNALQTNAIITASLRHTGSNDDTITRAAIGYINTASNPKIVWFKVNN